MPPDPNPLQRFLQFVRDQRPEPGVRSHPGERPLTRAPAPQDPGGVHPATIGPQERNVLAELVPPSVREILTPGGRNAQEGPRAAVRDLASGLGSLSGVNDPGGALGAVGPGPLKPGSSLAEILARREARFMPSAALHRRPEALQRAREQGFNVDRPLFHGTIAEEPFTAFRPGTFATPDPEIAGRYARSGPGNVYPFFLRGRAEDLSRARGATINQLLREPEVTRAIQQTADANHHFARMLEGVGHSEAVLLQNLFRGRGFDHVPGIPTAGQHLWVYPFVERAALQGLRRQGHGAVRLRDWHKLPTESTVVLDPARARSPFAAFDPARKHEADLLAGAAGLGLGLFGAAAGREDDHP